MMMYNCEFTASYDVNFLGEDGEIAQTNHHVEYYVTRARWLWLLKVKAFFMWLRLNRTLPPTPSSRK